jgi:hypothetical protein
MRNISTEDTTAWNGPVIARIGSGRLVEARDGRLELIGGTGGDYTNAKEWVSLFMPNKVLKAPEPPAGSHQPPVGARTGSRWSSQSFPGPFRLNCRAL